MPKLFFSFCDHKGSKIIHKVVVVKAVLAVVVVAVLLMINGNKRSLSNRMQSKIKTSLLLATCKYSLPS